MLGRGKQEKADEVDRVTPLPRPTGQVKDIHLYPKRESVGIISRERTLFILPSLSYLTFTATHWGKNESHFTDEMEGAWEPDAFAGHRVGKWQSSPSNSSVSHSKAHSLHHMMQHSHVLAVEPHWVTEHMSFRVVSWVWCLEILSPCILMLREGWYNSVHLNCRFLT